MAEISLSGYCKIISGEISILLVFWNGTIILAEYGEMKGAAAMEQIFHAEDMTVDVVIHDLNDPQLRLALEFNPSCVLPWNVRTGKGVGDPLRLPGKEAIIPHTPARGKTGAGPFEGRVPTSPGISTGSQPGGGKTTRHVPPTRADDETSLLARELEALDAFEIKSMAEKFRANCRQMIEKLDLEYLLEHNPAKENHDRD